MGANNQTKLEKVKSLNEFAESILSNEKYYAITETDTISLAYRARKAFGQIVTPKEGAKNYMIDAITSYYEEIERYRPEGEAATTDEMAGIANALSKDISEQEVRELYTQTVKNAGEIQAVVKQMQELEAAEQSNNTLTFILRQRMMKAGDAGDTFNRVLSYGLMPLIVTGAVAVAMGKSMPAAIGAGPYALILIGVFALTALAMKAHVSYQATKEYHQNIKNPSAEFAQSIQERLDSRLDKITSLTQKFEEQLVETIQKGQKEVVASTVTTSMANVTNEAEKQEEAAAKQALRDEANCVVDEKEVKDAWNAGADTGKAARLAANEYVQSPMTLAAQPMTQDNAVSNSPSTTNPTRGPHSSGRTASQLRGWDASNAVSGSPIGLDYNSRGRAQLQAVPHSSHAPSESQNGAGSHTAQTNR